MAKKRENKIKIWVLVVVVVLIITTGTAAFVFVMADRSTKEMGITAIFASGTGHPGIFEEIGNVDLSGLERVRFNTYKDLLIVADKYKIEAYDKRGNKKWSLPVMLANPLLKAGQSGVLLADTGGRIFYFIDDGGILWYGETDGDIVNASINDLGFICVVYEKGGYKGAVVVFDPEGKEVYTRYIADTFVFSSHIFESRYRQDQTVIISSMDISGIIPSTYLEFTDISGNPFAGFIPEKGELFPFTLILDYSSFVLHNENKVLLFKDRVKKEERNFGAISVLKGLPDGWIAAGVKKNIQDLHSCLILLDSDFNELFSADIDDDINTMDFKNGIIGVNTKREVYFYDTKGILKATYGSVSDIDEVLILDSSHVVVVTGGKMIFTKG